MMKNFEKANYGIDAPGVLFVLFLGGLICVFLGAWLPKHISSFPHLASILQTLFFLSAVVFFSEFILMINSSKRGKKKVIHHLLDKLNLTGDENVLDVGCGRGIFTIEMAKRLQKGHVIGIDIWQTKDQSGSSLANAQKNAEAEHVEQKVEFKTADMTSIPFPDHTFDLVTASLSIHNAKTKEERASAITEMARVLKPSGKMVILDFQFMQEYLETLEELGWKDIEISKRSIQTFPPVRTMIAKKP